MRAFCKFIVLVLLVFLMGCKETSQPISVVLEGQPETVAKVREWLQKNPEIDDPILGQKYIVKIIPPDSRDKHKITIIRPDPDIDFKIGIIGSAENKQMRELEEKLAELIRKHMRESGKSKK